MKHSFALDLEKFDKLVHYIIASCPDSAKLGSTKLQKILWKSDTGVYVLEGRPITGAIYKKRQYGPATDDLLASRKRLEENGIIRFWRDKKFTEDYPKDVYQNLARADASFLTPLQREKVDYWVKEICLKHTAESISDDTHGYAWEIAAMGEVLPLYAAFIDYPPDEPDEEAKKWAISEANRLNLRAV